MNTYLPIEESIQRWGRGGGGGDQTSLFSDWLNRSVMFLNKRAADDFDGVDNNDAFLNVGN